MEHLHRKSNFILSIILFSVLILSLINVVHSATQLNYPNNLILDLENLVFRYLENKFNDSSSTKDLIFNQTLKNITQFITLPRNATILFTNMTLEGVSFPSQTIATDEVLGVAVGDVNTSTSKNEIAVSVHGGVNLLDSDGNELWAYPLSGFDVYDVDIGNVTVDEGNEVAVASEDDRVYLLNSSGNQIWNYTVTGFDVNGISIGDVNTSTSENEIVIGANDNRVYLLNSSGNQIWNYTSSYTFFGVDIGNVTADAGNEIAAAANDGVYLLASNGTKIWSESFGTGINDVAIGDVDNDNKNEIVIGADDFRVYLLNSSGNQIWNYTTGAIVESVAVGNVTYDPGLEVVAGSRDYKVYILNSSGSLIWDYTTNDEVRGVDIGNVTTDLGNEVVAGSRDSNVYILNFEYYPTNPYLDVGDDGDQEWNYTGKLRESVNVVNSSITPEIQSYLDSNCASQSCDVPFVFHSDSGGDLKVSDINITYDYDASGSISHENLTNTWSRTDNVRVNETIGNEVKNISYNDPVNTINIHYVKVNDSASECDFGGTHYSSTTPVNGKIVCDVEDYSMNPGTSGSHLLWDDIMNASIPIYMNETSPVIKESYWKKNVTIWNETATIFTNVIANTTLNDTVINSNETLKVFWNNTWCDITPDTETPDCDSSDPTYSDKICGSDTFYVCKEDTGGNPGVVDFFKWKQPHTSTTVYEASGSVNHEANLTNGNVTPSTGIWGSEFNFTINVSDPDGDNVTVNLWVYLTNLGNWTKMGSKNTTTDTSVTPETIFFNVSSNISWIGNNEFRFEYRDFNDTGFVYHGWQFTKNYTGPTVTKHNVSIVYVQGNNTQVNRTGIDSVLLIVRINDTDNATIVGEGVSCSFWVTTDGENFDSGYGTVTNSSGYCNYSFDPSSTYSADKQWWKAGTNGDSYYLDKTSENFTLEIYGQLNINLTETIKDKNFTRTQNITLIAKTFDENNNIATVSGYNCTWFVNDTEIGNSTTNSSGYCIDYWNTTCLDDLGIYPINVTLWGSGSQYYYINKDKDNTNITLKDNLTITIINPLNASIIHEQETIVLNSSLSDLCGVPNKQYNVEWYFVQGGSPLCPDANPVATGSNTTWELNASCTPREQSIIVNATGNLYNTGSDQVLIYIYGWSIVNVITPSNSSTINRTETGGTTNVICRVKDNTTNNLYPEDYPVNFWYMDESSNEYFNGTKKTNSTGHVTFIWYIYNDTVPDGKYTVKCNITDNSTVYYNVSITEDTTSVTVIGHEDSRPPFFTGVRADSVEVYNNVTIEANVTDYYGVDKVWANIIYPNGTPIVHWLENISVDVQYGTWRTTLINLTQRGDYDFILYANDTTGNAPNSTTGWFEVYLPVQFYGNATDAYEQVVSIDFIFYRPGTTSIIHNFTSNITTGEYNYTIHKRLYDLENKVLDHTIKFYDLNTTNATSIVNPLNFTSVPLAVLSPPIAARHELSALDVNTNLMYLNATIELNYSDNSQIIDYEPAVTVLRCSKWSYPLNQCNTTWENLESERVVDTISHIVSVNVTNTSVYYVVEASICGNGLQDPGETCSNCPEDLGECPTGNGGTPRDGGNGGISPRCGNDECEAGENVYNCPEDCGYAETMFSLRTNLTNVQLGPGEEESYGLWITNNVKYAIDTSISIVGTASNFITLETTATDIESLTEKLVSMDVTIPGDTEPGVYTGDIIVTADGKTLSLPISITVSMEGAAYLDVVVETMTKIVGLNDTAKFHVMLYNLGFRKRLDLNMEYLIRDFNTEEIIHKEGESKIIQTSESFVKKIPLYGINITAGHYLFEIKVKYDNKIVSATDDFEVTTSFWTTERMTLVMLITLGTASIVALIYGRKRYLVWKLSKARYIFPIDMGKLPKGEIWLGKIAETKTKSYFNMDDLTTHVLTAGATGSGKSVSAMVFVEELLKEKIPVIVFDPTAQWTGFVRPCRDSNLIRYYKEFGLDRRDTRSYNGMIYEVTDPSVKINFKKYMNPGEITVFTLNRLKPGQYDDAVRSIIDTIFAQGWEESTKLRMIIVFDEVHRLLEKYGGKGGYVSLERACREFRKWGIGLIMASQVLSDFKEAIKGNVLTEVQLHTKSLGDLKRIHTKYGFEYAKRVTRQEVGIGMMQNPKYNEGRPWFVSFRPTLHSPHKIPDTDMNTYREYASLLEMIESRIGEMEKSGKDVFDFKTELKLAKDKLKKGRFRMAKIYIDSLNKHLSEG